MYIRLISTTVGVYLFVLLLAEELRCCEFLCQSGVLGILLSWDASV